MAGNPAVLDDVFRALSDSTRREVVERLTRGPASVSELAQPHGMSLPGFMKHLQVLEDAGLIVRAKEGRTVSCELAPRALEDASMWLEQYRKFWESRFDALGRFLYHEEEVRPWKANTAPANAQTARRKRASTSPAPTRSPAKGSGKRGPTRKRS